MFADKTLFGLIVSAFLIMTGVGMIVAILPQRIIEITGSGNSVGYLASSFALSYILSQVPVGSLSDKFGIKTFIISGYLLCCLAGIIFYFSKGTMLIFGGRLIQGAGEAPIWALAPALLSIKYPQKKGKMMGTYNAAIHLGLTIGPVLGIVLHKIWNGNQAFLLFAALCFAGAIVVYATVEKVHPNLEKEETSIKLRDLFSILRNKMVLLTLCGITMYGAGYGSFITVIPAFLISSKSFTPAYIGMFFSMFYAAISLSQLMFGSLSDKFGRMLFMVVGLFLAGVGITAFPFLESIWIIIVLTVASLGLGIFHISSMAFLNELVPDTLKGTISGAYYLFWGVGYFLGPLILSRNTVDSEPYSGFCYFSLLFISGAMAMSILYRKNHLS